MSRATPVPTSGTGRNRPQQGVTAVSPEIASDLRVCPISGVEVVRLLSNPGHPAAALIDDW